MSTFLDPIGPESSRTYWIRRVVALGALVLVLTVLIFVVVRPWQEDTAALSTTSDTSGLAKEASSNVSSEMNLPRTCAPASTTLSLSGPNAITATEPVDFTVTIAVAGEACVLDLNTQPFELRVFSGTDRIWSTNDCVAAELTGLKELSAGENVFAIQWPTRRSSAGCQLSESQLRAGTYVATAEIMGISPDQQVMVLN